MTREHVIPAFMYSFQKELERSVIGWNEVAGKMLPGELKVKDVCSTCNNHLLSDLDAYGKSLLIDSGTLVQNYTKLNMRLTYDFDKLVRWLLKISFNSSRTDGAHSYLFESLVPYILGNSVTPARSRLAVIAYLAAPVILDKEERQREPFKRLTANSPRLNPFLARICYGVYRETQNFTLRMNIFGPLVFYMLLFADDVLPGHAASEIRRFLKGNPNAIELRPNRKVVELSAGPKSWRDLYRDQIARVHRLERSDG